MATQWLRRGWLSAVLASVLALAACGGGDVVSELDPSRVVVFGDAVADIGQNGRRYTVNNGTANVWAERVALEYGVTLAPSANGGTNFAAGNARIAAKPDAAGNAATPTVTEQVDAFLATRRFSKDDLVLVNAGTSDLVVQGRAVIDGTRTQAQALAAVTEAGSRLASQVERMVDAGATYVVVVGPYNLGRTPWARDTDRASVLEDLTTRFNDALKVELFNAGLGNNVLFVDAALLFNRATSSPGEFGLDEELEVPVCTSVDPGPGIGTGAGQVNSNLCTPATLRAGVDLDNQLWADRIYLTPVGHQLLADYAREQIRERF